MKIEKTRDKAFKVFGAGDIYISPENFWTTANEKGFSFSVSWGKNGNFGGVLSNREAFKLSIFLLINLIISPIKLFIYKLQLKKGLKNEKYI